MLYKDYWAASDNGSTGALQAFSRGSIPRRSTKLRFIMAIEYIVIGKETCGFCTKAKQLLNKHKKEFTYRDVKSLNSADIDALQEIAGKEFQTVPQIFKYKAGGGLEYVGGYSELSQTKI